MYSIILNGEKKVIKENLTLEKMMKSLNINQNIMGIAVNMQVIQKENWKETYIKDNDKVEILNFVAGG